MLESPLPQFFAKIKDFGFTLVETQVRVPGTSLRADFVAWGNDGNGSLRPFAVFETTATTAPFPASKWEQVRQYAAMLEAPHFYIISDQGVFKEANGQVVMASDDELRPPNNTDEAVLNDFEQLLRLTQEALKLLPKRANDSQLAGLLKDILTEGIPLDNKKVPVEPAVAVRAFYEAQLSRETTHGSHQGTSQSISDLFAKLAGSIDGKNVLDPAAGLGRHLLALGELNPSSETSFHAIDIDPVVLNAASLSLSACEIPAECIDGDFLERDTAAQFDLIVMTPPIGMRLANPFVGSSRRPHRETDLAFFDKALSSLKPGGRLIAEMNPRFLFSKQAEELRELVSSEFHLAALIQLPRASVSGTVLKTVAVVVDRVEPGPTFVANLGDDWVTQMESGTGFLAAALDHLEGGQS